MFNLARKPKERRNQRSPWASEALHLQLLRVAHSFRLDALVLSDSLGNLWAASSQEASPQAISSLIRLGLSPDGPRLCRLRQGKQSVLVRKLRVGETTLFLAARGAPRRSRPALEQAAPGVERILGALL